MIPARRITVRAVNRPPKNELEGDVTFLFFGREIQARVILPDAEWEEWGPGYALEGEVYLYNRRDVLREVRPPALTLVGDRTFYTAAGRVKAVYGDGWYILDCGIPLPVRMEDHHPETYVQGEAIVVSGVMQLVSDDWDSTDPTYWIRLLLDDPAAFSRARDLVPTRIDLRGVDLRNRDLRQAHLELCDLTGADLRGAFVRSGRLATCRLEGVLTEGLRTTDDEPIRQIRLLWEGGWNSYRKAVRPRALPLADFSGADLGDADLSGMVLRGANLEGANLSRCNLRRCEFNGANLNHARLSGTHDHVDFDDASLIGADCTGLQLEDSTALRARFDGANLAGIKLDNVRVADAQFIGADLRNAVLLDVDFLGANLTGASLEGALVRNCVFMYSTGAVFRGAKIEHT